jgi:hypothetical protein
VSLLNWCHMNQVLLISQHLAGSLKTVAGLPVQATGVQRHRVANSTKSGRCAVQSVATAINRSVRNTRKCKVQQVHNPTAQQSGSRLGCTSNELGLAGRLCVPSFPTNNEGVAKGQKVRQHVHDPIGSNVASSTVVHHTVGASHRHAQGTSAASRLANTTRRKFANKSHLVPVTRVEAIKQLLIAKHFPEQVAQAAASTSSKGTTSLYQCHWVRFRSWCLERGYHPLYPTVPQLAEFFHNYV